MSTPRRTVLPPSATWSPRSASRPPRRPPTLPPIANDQQYTLVMDLDETLVKTTLLPVPYQTSSGLTRFVVQERPFAREFLKFVHDLRFEIVVFTAGTKIYADKVLDILDEGSQWVSHRLYRHHTSVLSSLTDSRFKDLSLLGRDLRRTLLIDDRETCFSAQADNGLLISPWNGSQSFLSSFLQIPHLPSIEEVDVTLFNVFCWLEELVRSGMDVPTFTRLNKHKLQDAAGLGSVRQTFPFLPYIPPFPLRRRSRQFALNVYTQLFPFGPPPPESSKTLRWVEWIVSSASTGRSGQVNQQVLLYELSVENDLSVDEDDFLPLYTASVHSEGNEASFSSQNIGKVESDYPGRKTPRVHCDCEKAEDSSEPESIVSTSTTSTSATTKSQQVHQRSKSELPALSSPASCARQSKSRKSKKAATGRRGHTTSDVIMYDNVGQRVPKLNVTALTQGNHNAAQDYSVDNFTGRTSHSMPMIRSFQLSGEVGGSTKTSAPFRPSSHVQRQYAPQTSSSMESCPLFLIESHPSVLPHGAAGKVCRKRGNTSAAVDVSSPYVYEEGIFPLTRSLPPSYLTSVCSGRFPHQFPSSIGTANHSSLAGVPLHWQPSRYYI